MRSGLWKRIACVALVSAAALGAQQFEVVSIRPVPRDAPPTLREMDFTPVRPGGQYIDSRTLLMFMISFAYDVKNPSLQLAGLPNWAKEESYSVAAKPAAGFPLLPPAENREQVRRMMRAMLEDRFQLKLHTETRQEAVLDLEVEKGGLKIQAVDPPVPPQKEGFVGAAAGNSGGRMIGKKSTMRGIANALTIFLKRPVNDKTGLTGYYDFDVKWSAPEPLDGRPPAPGLGADGTGLLISMLRKEFGLRLTKTTGPVEYWVVDHVEPPTGN